MGMLEYAASYGNPPLRTIACHVLSWPERYEAYADSTAVFWYSVGFLHSERCPKCTFEPVFGTPYCFKIETPYLTSPPPIHHKRPV